LCHITADVVKSEVNATAKIFFFISLKQLQFVHDANGDM